MCSAGGKQIWSGTTGLKKILVGSQLGDFLLVLISVLLCCFVFGATVQRLVFAGSSSSFFPHYSSVWDLGSSWQHLGLIEEKVMN